MKIKELIARLQQIDEQEEVILQYRFTNDLNNPITQSLLINDILIHSDVPE